MVRCTMSGAAARTGELGENKLENMQVKNISIAPKKRVQCPINANIICIQVNADAYDSKYRRCIEGTLKQYT